MTNSKSFPIKSNKFDPVKSNPTNQAFGTLKLPKKPLSRKPPVKEPNGIPPKWEITNF